MDGFAHTWVSASRRKTGTRKAEAALLPVAQQCCLTRKAALWCNLIRAWPSWPWQEGGDNTGPAALRCGWSLFILPSGSIALVFYGGEVMVWPI